MGATTLVPYGVWAFAWTDGQPVSSSEIAAMAVGTVITLAWFIYFLLYVLNNQNINYKAAWLIVLFMLGYILLPVFWLKYRLLELDGAV